ncbi:MAG: leucine-rich repeat protein [Clostridia bacterium]|nr:leucine-rich repeat protein [Clostridia bacterium]
MDEREFTCGDYRYTLADDGGAVIEKYLAEDNKLKIPAEPDGHRLTAIGKYAFFDCSLTDVTIPSSVNKIGESAFSSRDNLLHAPVRFPLIRIKKRTLRFFFMTRGGIPLACGLGHGRLHAPVRFPLFRIKKRTLRFFFMTRGGIEFSPAGSVRVRENIPSLPQAYSAGNVFLRAPVRFPLFSDQKKNLAVLFYDPRGNRSRLRARSWAPTRARSIPPFLGSKKEPSGSFL